LLFFLNFSIDLLDTKLDVLVVQPVVDCRKKVCLDLARW